MLSSNSNSGFLFYFMPFFLFTVSPPDKEIAKVLFHKHIPTKRKLKLKQLYSLTHISIKLFN